MFWLPEVLFLERKKAYSQNVIAVDGMTEVTNDGTFASSIFPAKGFPIFMDLISTKGMKTSRSLMWF